MTKESAERAASLEADLGREREEHAAAREAIKNLEAKIDATEMRAQALQSDLADAHAKVETLETNLAETRDELSQTKDSLSRESVRHQRAMEKWDRDRVSLNRAKDALAVCLAKIEEAEMRQPAAD